MVLRVAINVISALLILTGCAGVQISVDISRPDTVNRARMGKPVETGADKTGLLVAEGAMSLVGREELIVNGKTFPNDCTGVVRARFFIMKK